MKVGNIPEELVKQAKELGLELVKPASKEGIRKIAIGAGIGGAISPLYSRGFDYLWSLSPVQNKILKTTVKILLPLGISAIALKTKIPGGNIIAGVPVGVSIAEGVKTGISLITGKLPVLSKTTKYPSKYTEQSGPAVVDTAELEPWGVF